MATTYLSRTPASSGTLTTWTYSCWVKRLKTDDDAYLIWSNDSGTTDNDSININTSNVIYWNIKNSNSSVGRLVTNQVFRDTSAWYHLVFVWDTTNATSGDRMRIYVNGERVTSFSTETQPSQNTQSSSLNANKLHLINETNYGGSYGSNQTDILMAHVHWIDGTAYDADTFGETDATTGIWKPKTAPSVTYGTNGFFLKFENSGAFGTDSSGNSNTFTVNGTMTQTLDTPSNVFATANPIDFSGTAPTLGNGNLSLTTAVTSDYPFRSTLAFSKGKYYCEVKRTDASNENHLGIWSADNSLTSNYVGYQLYSWGLFTSNGNKRNNQSYDSYGSGIAQNDIVMIAVDKDNGKIWWGKNGTWFNSGDPASGTNEAFSNINTVVGTDGLIAFCSLTQATHQWNFGNGYFGTTAVSSAQNPDDGIGIFEYDVPAGYRALCTKSINAEEYS